MNRILTSTLAALIAVALSRGEIQVGSKRFTESYILGEIATLELEKKGLDAQHRQGMGGTIVLWQALQSGSVDAYPEYTGTIAEQILKRPELTDFEAISDSLQTYGIRMTAPLGFNNTYALVMRRELAESLSIESISDLRDHPGLTLAFTHEFLDRSDGWNALSNAYGLHDFNVSGIDHALGYSALESGSIDVTDAYSTDAKIALNDLKTLRDDLSFFPEYKAVFLYRDDMDPDAARVLEGLAGSFPQREMTRLNALAESRNDFRAAARQFSGTEAPASAAWALAERLAKLTAEHLLLVGLSMLAAILVGLPLGVIAGRPGWLSQSILGVAGALQTIPALALLALLVPVPFLGISALTAIVALFLYSLLPIIRNTASGLQDIAPELEESALVLGLSSRARLFRIRLPLASRSILAGIKTSSVINIGTATLAALIGGGGLGEPIISGLSLNDHRLILTGALPAAALALGVQALFETADRWLIPKGLR